MDLVFEQAEKIANDPRRGPNEAAQYLGNYRREAAEAFFEDVSRLDAVLAVVVAQIRYLNDADLPDKGTAIAEWFLHLMHHVFSEHAGDDGDKVKILYREALATFYRHYAKSLRNVGRFSDMRKAMRQSMDLSREIPMSVVFLVHLYMPLQEIGEVEEKPAKTWLLDRYAECLAALDVSGLHDTPFREAFDLFQLSVRMPEKSEEIGQKMESLCGSHPEDLSLKTLHNLFKSQCK